MDSGQRGGAKKAAMVNWAGRVRLVGMSFTQKVFIVFIFMDSMIINVTTAVFMFPITMAMVYNRGVNGLPFS